MDVVSFSSNQTLVQFLCNKQLLELVNRLKLFQTESFFKGWGEQILFHPDLNLICSICISYENFCQITNVTLPFWLDPQSVSTQLYESLL